MAQARAKVLGSPLEHFPSQRLLVSTFGKLEINRSGAREGEERPILGESALGQSCEELFSEALDESGVDA